ncbi:MAG: FecR domain-containing protein [Chitinophagaceae bacterium]|nr:FecR domain-containing protein [Chitinophagaceae bacterium]
MNEDRFWSLVSLRLSGEALPEEVAELEMLLQQHPELGLRAGMLDTVWQAKHKALPDSIEASFNKHMQRLSNHFAEPVLQYENDIAGDETETGAPVRSLFRKRILWVSGIAASLFIGWLLFTDKPEQSKPEKPPQLAQNTISTKRGSKSKVQLPDGTQVWLNADSRITYNENFQGTLREVQLTGEAFFDVVRDETRPFVIHTKSIDVKVLGTAFNVRSYEDEKNTETSLIHGSVEITLKNNPDKKIVLKPNEKLIVKNNDMKLVTEKPESRKTELKLPLLTLGKVNYQKKDSSVIETLWVKNKLAFDGEALEDVALKIERWFDVKVIIADERLKRVPFSAVFDDEDLQQVMEAVKAGVGEKARFNINKKEVTIGR